MEQYLVFRREGKILWSFFSIVVSDCNKLNHVFFLKSRSHCNISIYKTVLPKITIIFKIHCINISIYRIYTLFHSFIYDGFALNSHLKQNQFNGDYRGQIQLIVPPFQRGRYFFLDNLLKFFVTSFLNKRVHACAQILNLFYSFIFLCI